jgi:thiol-disulfide isomerase/thioredoxin
MLRNAAGGLNLKDKKIFIIVLVAVLLSVFTMQCYRPAPEAGSVEIGQTAPQFKLYDMTGHAVSLDQYKGKIVVLDFWATWCGPCRESMPKLDKIQEEYAGKMVLLAINVQEPESVVRDYLRSQSLAAKVLLDEDGSVGRQYGAVMIPMQVLIDREGVVRHVVNGFNPQIKAEIKKLL